MPAAKTGTYEGRIFTFAFLCELCALRGFASMLWLLRSNRYSSDRM
jgi:hypothetical protein